MSEFIRDHMGRLIGHLVESGVVTFLYDGKGRLIGTYNSHSDTTLTAIGQLVGRGNQLMRLLRYG